MPTLSTLVAWLQSGSGRMTAAALVFASLWALKAVPYIREQVLTTPRRKQAAAVLLALGPAALLLADPTVPWTEVATTALGLALSAMGVNALRPSKSEPPEATP